MIYIYAHNNNEAVEVAPNKKRVPVVPIIGIMISIFLFYGLLTLKRSDNENKIFWYYLLIGFFISALYYTIITAFDYLRAMLSSKARLVITDRGIEDNLSIFSCGYISWAEVTGVQLIEILTSKFLVININNADLLMQQQSKWKQKTLRSYLKQFGSPVVIAQKKVGLKLEELKDIIRENMK